MDTKKKTVGAHARELLIKETQVDHSPEEQMREQLSDYESYFNDCFIQGKKYHGSRFFIVVTTKKERLMQNVIRNYFLSRKSCPTPEYDQIVYEIKDDTATLLWVVPAKDICSYLYYNATTLPEEQRELLQYVMDFLDGTLLHKAKKLNGEE